ncbi:iron-hydroxamate ABC transporter substrate-binding protein [Neobacillus notoginsengisoli]|uniref:Iron-hydroxamate ABC transporter substrate-binding protein n=1 Tax=Neobacillus notoginsengisoli TaxID=1578198 RepID=A0A417YX45_9BACI|nr:iron-hydroxamate ABC transporter substrate-binding protein [Neobacillus notoginsengisoli]RHW42002.1 iron-hydroxamate ABC transporter substrate-binding protein [Neobacillus notoginsengisoli]
MTKKLMPILLVLALVLSACGSKTGDKNNESAKKDEKPTTITYQSENGPVEVPADPQRIVVLSFSYSGSVLALGGNIVGIDAWSKANPRFEDGLKNAEVVTDENLEKIIELEPDLIIGQADTKNVDKLKKIAPTVTITYGKNDYLTQHIEIGKLLNKEREATEWVENFKKEAAAAGEEIKAKIGADATVSVIENQDKQLFVFGENFARGTEILYQEMKLNMPEKVKQDVLKPGFYAISPEVLADYAGDYVIFSKNSDGDTSFQQTETYKNIPAVKNNRVFEVNAKEFYFNDPITLEYQLDFFKKSFLGE